VICETSVCRLWYKKDIKFKVPRGSLIHYNIIQQWLLIFRDQNALHSLYVHAYALLLYVFLFTTWLYSCSYLIVQQTEMRMIRRMCDNIAAGLTCKELK